MSKGPVKINSGDSRDETVIAGLSELGQLARHAFEDKRRKQCLALTTAILKIDPENKEALVIQAWVREDLVKDVTSARQQVEEARRENSLGLWDRAERLLRGVVSVDPDHEEAKALLTEVIPAQRALAETGPLEDDEVSQQPTNSSRRVIAVIVFGAVAVALIAFFAFKPPKATITDPSADNKDNSSAAEAAPPAPVVPPVTGSFEFFVLPQQGVQLSVDDAPAQPVPQKVDLSPGLHTLVFTSEGYLAQNLSETIVAGRSRALPIIMKPLLSSDPPEKPEKKGTVPPKNAARPAEPASRTAGTRSEPASKPPDQTASAGQSEGSLAISAAIPVDVYFAGKALGTTPLTVKLPSGVQTLEYKFQGQTKSAAHIIRSGETTRATIGFDLTLQIQASPWANVSIEGPEGRALGQTPLSNVTIPVGSVLVFQNPNFPVPEKRVRVSGKDTEKIVVRFP